MTLAVDWLQEEEEEEEEEEEDIVLIKRHFLTRVKLLALYKQHDQKPHVHIFQQTEPQV